MAEHLLAHRDIMVVDDNLNNLMLLEEMLRQQGCEVSSFPGEGWR